MFVPPRMGPYPVIEVRIAGALGRVRAGLRPVSEPTKHFVTDHGAQFVGEALQNLITSLDLGHRKAAIGEHGSIAVERL
jgi:hypothetical protein